MSHQTFSYQEIPTYTKMNALADDISDNASSHNHTGDTSGKKLTWDNCWVDGVHDHSSIDEGGQLEWDNCWSDCVHDHSSDSEGGQIYWNTCWADGIHDHSGAAEGGKLNFSIALFDAKHDHSNAGEGGQIPTAGIQDEFANTSIIGYQTILTDKIGDGEVGGAKFKVDSTEVSTDETGVGGENLTIGSDPSNNFFYPQLKTSAGGQIDDVSIAKGYMGGYVNLINIRMMVGTGYARLYYIKRE